MTSFQHWSNWLSIIKRLQILRHADFNTDRRTCMSSSSIVFVEEHQQVLAGYEGNVAASNRDWGNYEIVAPPDRFMHANRSCTVLYCRCRCTVYSTVVYASVQYHGLWLYKKSSPITTGTNLVSAWVSVQYSIVRYCGKISAARYCTEYYVWKCHTHHTKSVKGSVRIFGVRLDSSLTIF